jgi:hypothetical protein
MYYFRCRIHGDVKSSYYNRCPSCVRDRRLSYASSLEHINYPTRQSTHDIVSRIRRNINISINLPDSDYFLHHYNHINNPYLEDRRRIHQIRYPYRRRRITRNNRLYNSHLSRSPPLRRRFLSTTVPNNTPIPSIEINFSDSSSEEEDMDEDDDFDDIERPQRVNKEKNTKTSIFTIKESQKYEKFKCQICLDKYLTGNKIRLLPCMHYYHKKCVDKWFDISLKCPICQNKLSGPISNISSINL